MGRYIPIQRVGKKPNLEWAGGRPAWPEQGSVQEECVPIQRVGKATQFRVGSLWEESDPIQKVGKSAPIWNGQAAGPPGPGRAACGKNVSQSREWEKQPNPEWAACGKKVTRFRKWEKSVPIWSGQPTDHWH